MKRTVMAALLGTALIGVPLAGVVIAAENTDKVVAASQGVDKKEAAAYDALMKVSDDGYQTLRGIRAARISIFNGDPQAAGRYVDGAIGDIGKARKDAAGYIKPKGKENDGQDWITVDSSMGVGEDFVVTEKNKPHIVKANEHMKKGDAKQAVDELKLAEVDVSYTRVMMPLQLTEDHVRQAKDMLADHKYYEANLELKAAEDGIVIDTVSLAGLPESKTAPAQPASGQTVTK